MYTSNPFLQNIRSSSFLIRDILGSDGTLAAAGADRYGTFEQTLAPSGYPAPSGSFPAHNAPGAGNPYQSTKEFGYFSPQTFGYQDLRKGYSIENLLEANQSKDGGISIPIPLPVYIRTRSPSGSDGYGKAKRCRRSRTVFTDLQLMALEKRFESQKYLSTPDRIDVAEALGLTQLQVKTWYQNRRMKWKKQVMQDGGSESPTKPKGRPKKDTCSASSTCSADTTCQDLGTNDNETHNHDVNVNADERCNEMSVESGVNMNNVENRYYAGEIQDLSNKNICDSQTVFT